MENPEKDRSFGGLEPLMHKIEAFFMKTIETVAFTHI